MFQQDLRFALRRLRQDKGVAASAILTLAIGIGACTALFSIVLAVLLRPFGIDVPDRVVIMWPTTRENPAEFTYRTHADLRVALRAFDGLALLSSTTWAGSLDAGGSAVPLSGSVVSATFFDVLDATPLLGRTFRADDDQPSAPPTVVLSHRLWTRHFGSDPAVIGRTLRITEEGHVTGFEVVGVMRSDLFFPRGADYWTPAAARLARISQHLGEPLEPLFNDLGVFFAIGRLSPAASIDVARAEAATLVAGGATGTKVDPATAGIAISPLVDHIFGQARPSLLLLMGAVCIVLLVACTNVATLLLARCASRARELAVRAAIGATRWRLARQVLTEGGVLVVLGAILGVSAAALSLDVLLGLSPSDIPRLDESTLDLRVLAFALAITTATTFGLGAAPAWLFSRPALVDELKGPAGGTGRTRIRQFLVVIQVAGTLVLLVASGLCARSFARLVALDLGFDPANVLTFSIAGFESRYPPPDRARDAIELLIARFERIPQVVAAGALSQRPFENGAIGWDTRFLLEGQPDTPESWNRNAMLNWETVAGDYFRSMGIKLLHGRSFARTDTAEAPPVVIVSDAMAAQVWPGQDPIGKRLRQSFAHDDRWQTVVGVVGTARYREIEHPRLDLYVPLRQGADIKHFTVRTTIAPRALIPALRAELLSFDETLRLDSVMTMDEIVRRTRGPWEFNVLVFGIFGFVAAALAAMGLFGLVSYAVGQRTHEIGVRMALGAARGSVVRLCVAQGLRPAMAGFALGLGIAVFTTGALSSLLFETSPTDPATFGVVLVLFGAVTALASYWPARRAASVDPTVALRDQ